MKKFQNKYRIPSTRMQNWDYGCNAAYFVTICTKNQICYFGVGVETPKLAVSTHIHLSEIGKIAEEFWMEIPNHFPFVRLGEFVVMPNHVHGIIIIDKPVETPKLGVSTLFPNPDISHNPNPTNHHPPTPPKPVGKNDKWKPGTLGVIINQYKRICTIHASMINPDFSWQPRFHDRIIRDREAWRAIDHYIRNNPANWHDDEYRN